MASLCHYLEKSTLNPTSLNITYFQKSWSILDSKKNASISSGEQWWACLPEPVSSGKQSNWWAMRWATKAQNFHRHRWACSPHAHHILTDTHRIYFRLVRSPIQTIKTTFHQEVNQMTTLLLAISNVLKNILNVLLLLSKMTAQALYITALLSAIKNSILYLLRVVSQAYLELTFKMRRSRKKSVTIALRPTGSSQTKSGSTNTRKSK